MDSTAFIARRYLFSKKHVSLISTLTFISITGVTIGTALLIIVLSVFNGFFDAIKGFLLSYDPDIRIESAVSDTFAYDQNLINSITAIPEVTIASPYVEGKALLAYENGHNQVVDVKGIEKERYFQLANIEESITSGVFDLSVRNQKPGLVMHDQLRAELQIGLGDEVALLSSAGMKKALTQITVPRVYHFEERGAYYIEQIVEDPKVFIDLEAAQRLFKARNSITGIDVKLTNTEDARTVKSQLTKMLGPEFRVSTWYDLQKPLYDVMYLEKWGAFLILMIIVLVAVLNIVGSLSMIVIQKQRDIGILMSMGYTPASIKSIFRKQGLYIGIIGAGIGGALGLIICFLQKQFGLVKLSSAFIIDAYPVQINFGDVAIILGGSLLLCILASWYPANKAALIQPADAVRYE